MTWLAALALPLLLLFVGRGFGRHLAEPAQGAAYRALVHFLAGLIAWHLVLNLLSLAGIPWSRTVLILALLVLIAVPRLAFGRARGPAPTGPGGERGEAAPPGALGWGDGIAAAAVLAFALLAATLWITTPDFFYHWGLKGEHFFLARGIDYRWLAESWNAGIHPDYPNLLPELYATTAVLAGRFAAPAQMLWSALFLGFTIVAAREAMVRGAARGASRFAEQATVALVALAAVAYGIGFVMAGGADSMMALALIASLPPLLGLSGGADGPQIGLAAAFAASSKLEGLPLAAFLIVVYLAGLLRSKRGAWRETAIRRAAAWVVLPTVAVVAPWLLAVQRHGLFQSASNSGPFDWERGRVIFPAMLSAIGAGELHGLPWLVALLPIAWLRRRTRPFAAVATAQLLFYAWAYFASSLEPHFYVLSNFARLVFHLLPAVIVAVVLATEPEPTRRSS
ncbi:MAG TPA: hypothetical protein VOA87_18720 [Thermoanaerobaculia bacterium]|nr:hypothetical protein [Thermoanaerobaculia bacterium]